MSSHLSNGYLITPVRWQQLSPEEQRRLLTALENRAHTIRDRLNFLRPGVEIYYKPESILIARITGHGRVYLEERDHTGVLLRSRNLNDSWLNTILNEWGAGDDIS